MRPRIARMIRGVAAVLVASLALAAWERCIGAAAPLALQKACCAKRGHDRATVGDAMACCEAQQPAKERLIRSELAAPVPPLAPVVLPLAALVVTFDASDWLSAQAHTRAAFGTPGVPAYLTSGALLI